MICIIFISIVTLTFGLAYVFYRKAFFSPNKSQNDIYNIPDGEQYRVFYDEMVESIDRLSSLPFEQIHIISRDGLRLCGRYYHVKDGAPLAICFHGYRATAVRDFCGGAMACVERGLNVLLIDQRAQGLSDGHTISFGAKEKLDCLDWISYAIDRFGIGTRIILFGISMGAATVLLALGLSLPKNVIAVVADSPYSSAEAILKKVCADIKLPACAVYPFIWLGAAVFGHFRIGDGDVVSAISHSPVPVLIIHGEDDRFVPCEMSRQLRSACPQKVRLETFPGAGHGISYMTDKTRYRAVVFESIDPDGKLSAPVTVQPTY